MTVCFVRNDDKIDGAEEDELFMITVYGLGFFRRMGEIQLEILGHVYSLSLSP